MGLCLSANRELRKLCKNEFTEKRTFNGKTLMARLSSIYDGDTFNIITRLGKNEPFYEYSIRLAGVDAPEMRPLMTMADRDLHKRAAVAVRDILRIKFPNKSIFLVDFDKEDKYGRLLGTLWSTKKTYMGLGCLRKDINISQWLLDNNMVLPYDGGTKNGFTREHLENICKQCDVPVTPSV